MIIKGQFCLFFHKKHVVDSQFGLIIGTRSIIFYGELTKMSFIVINFAESPFRRGAEQENIQF